MKLEKKTVKPAPGVVVIRSVFGFASFECRKVIGFLLLRYTIGLQNSRHCFFIQSEVKPKPVMTCSHTFSRVSGQLDVMTSSFDWFTVLSFVIGWKDYFAFGHTTLN